MRERKKGGNSGTFFASGSLSLLLFSVVFFYDGSAVALLGQTGSNSHSSVRVLLRGEAWNWYDITMKVKKAALPPLERWVSKEAFHKCNNNS